MARDFYEALGVSRDADASQVQRAYRRWRGRTTPTSTRTRGAEERFKEVSEAYDVLSDPEQRKRYDAFGEDFRRVPPDMDPAAYRQQQRAYAGAGARGASGGRGPWDSGAGRTGGTRFDFGDDVDLEDLLGGMFGSRERRGWGTIPVRTRRRRSR